jgi:hypothetical protein
VIYITWARIFAGQLKGEQFRTHAQESYLRNNLAIDVAKCLSEINYLVVLTIARRLAPFANCKDTLVVLELIGENFTILPVIPVLLVVNKSPSWYVYPPSVIWVLPFCLGLGHYLSSLTYFGGIVKYPQTIKGI